MDPKTKAKRDELADDWLRDDPELNCDFSFKEGFDAAYELLKDCKHPKCCCVCGHEGKCPECGPCLIGGIHD